MKKLSEQDRLYVKSLHNYHIGIADNIKYSELLISQSNEQIKHLKAKVRQEKSEIRFFNKVVSLSKKNLADWIKSRTK